MSSEETPLPVLQTRSEDGLMIQNELGTAQESCTLTSDVNENKVDTETNISARNEEILVPRRDAQDSLNNNENCNLMCGQLSCKKGCEDCDHTTVESSDSSVISSREANTFKEKRVNNRRNNRSKKSCNGKSTGFSAADDIGVSHELKSTDSAQILSTLESNTSLKQRDQKHIQGSVFSLVEEEFVQTEDARMLPTCLHQIAEIYFQEENYEKAMQFIQLERMYHEQLLANLSAIQEQWEKKWKLTDSTSSPSPQNSEKCLSSKELETLSSLCGSHQEPKISKHKLSASEKTLKIQCLTQLIQTDGFRDLDSPAGTPVRESNSGSRPRKDRKPGVAAMTDNSPPNVISEDKPTEAADHQAMPELGHTEEQQLCSSRALLEVHTQSTGTVGRANPGSFSTGDAGKNNNLLQPEAASHCQDVTEIEAFSEDHREEHTGKPVADKLISAGAAQADCVSGAHDDLSGMISSLDCSSPIQTAKVISNIQEHCTIIGEGDAKELRLANPKLINIESTQREASESHESTSDPKCSLETERSAQRQAAVEFIASLLNGDLKDSENFLAHLDLQEEALSEEEMSPSPGDAVLGDSFLSLDELAKRIEVEEINPASGLVSILKKRNESEGEKLAETPQKPAKRKVRFQETDDVLDQEEIGGGSCILLVLLCVVTVFLSIGGTALYCTFGDVDSSVCKDFAANVDFYYTQLLQGFEELKHWLYVT